MKKICVHVNKTLRLENCPECSPDIYLSERFFDQNFGTRLIYCGKCKHVIRSYFISNNFEYYKIVGGKYFHRSIIRAIKAKDEV